MPTTPQTGEFPAWAPDDPPIIDPSDDFTNVVTKLSTYIRNSVDAAYTYEQLRTSAAGAVSHSLRPLISSLSENCHHQALLAALLTAGYAFSIAEGDGTGIDESRALACELVAWQFLTFLSEKELIDYLLYELPKVKEGKGPSRSVIEAGNVACSADSHINETAPLLRFDADREHEQLLPPRHAKFDDSVQREADTFGDAEASADELAEAVAGMNALEIAAIGNAKKFMSQKPVQKLVTDIWHGDVIFWDSLSVHTIKKPRIHNKHVADPFTRLRVPKYQKALQVGFFVSFLLLYYAVLVERNTRHVTTTEIFLYVWIAAFAYDEFGELQDAGLKFYQTDFWSLWDIAIIAVGMAFFVMRVIGLARNSFYIIDIAFDVLSMVALFLVPRICSVMSLNPYFGSLIPVLKEMTKAFCRFLPVIVVLYLGFLTTFTMLARDRLNLREMSWILVKVFFGSSYLGFDVAVTISPIFGYTLMIIFVCLTNILLITALVSLVSNSLTEVMQHAREEYLFQYSIYVLESSTSRRLTYFMPPLNLIPLLLLRPLRLFLSSEDNRRIRILVLKATHFPFVALIWLYERSQRLILRSIRPPSAQVPLMKTRPFSAGHVSLDRDREQGRSSLQRRALNRSSPMATRHEAEDFENSASRSADKDLLALVQKLSAQVDDLTSMIAGQQKD